MNRSNITTGKVVIVTGAGNGVGANGEGADSPAQRVVDEGRLEIAKWMTPQTAEGWTPETIVSHALPAMKPSFYPLDISSHVFTWDPF